LVPTRFDTSAGLVFKLRRTDNSVSTQSAGDIFGMANGTSCSKHDSNVRLKDPSYIGADNAVTNSTASVWIVRSNHQGDSGGPFYRSLLKPVQHRSGNHLHHQTTAKRRLRSFAFSD